MIPYQFNAGIASALPGFANIFGLKHGNLPGLEANLSLEIRMLQEFKEFALRGNVVDMAVGIIIGAAFSTIVRSLVDDIVMPPVGVLTGGVDFSNIFIALNGQHYDSLAQARQAGAPTLNIGVFINNVISFLIVAMVLFMAIKAMNRLRRKQEEEPQSEPPPSREVQVLEEIRDALLDRRDRPA